jgi:hypothetical protein
VGRVETRHNPTIIKKRAITYQDRFSIRILPASYKERITTELKGAIIPWLIIFGGLIIGLSLPGLLLASALYLLYYLELRMLCRYHILGITRSEASITVSYMDRDEIKNANGNSQDFDVSIGSLWYKIRPPLFFFRIRYKGELLCKQYAWLDVKREVFKEIKKLFV